MATTEIAVKKKIPGPTRCTARKACGMLAFVLAEIEKAAPKRGRYGLEPYVKVGGVDHGASGLVLRVGPKRGAPKVMLNCCPWCGESAQVKKPASSPRARAKRKAAPAARSAS